MPSHLGAPLEAFWARFGPSLGVQNRAIWAPLQGVEGSCCRNDGFSKIIEKPMVFQHFGLVWAFQKGYKSSIICSKTASQIIFVYDSLRMPFWNSFHPFGRPFWAPKSLQESLSGAISVPKRGDWFSPRRFFLLDVARNPSMTRMGPSRDPFGTLPGPSRDPPGTLPGKILGLI